MTAPRSLGIGRLPNGGLAIVDERGVQIPADRRITTTASDLARLLAAGIEISIRDAAEVVGPGMVAGLRKAIQAGSKAGAQAGFDAGMKVGAKAGAVEGVQAGARYVLKNSRVHRSVERDEEGRIIGSIETREPRESLKSGGNISLMRESLGVPLAALCARGSSARTTRVGLAAQSAECLRRGVDSGLWRLRLASHSLLHGLKA